MSLLNNIVSEQVIHSLGWTIVHSLWQATLAAGLFFLLMLLLRKSSSRLRYYTGILTLLLVVVMAAVTFVGTYNSYSSGLTAAAKTEKAVTAAAGVGQEGASLLTVLQEYFNQHMPLIVGIWLLGVLVLVLRLAGGFLLNARIKAKHTAEAPPYWQARLKILARKINLRKTVLLKESALARLPMTIGYLKPIVFVPMGLLTGLPQDQVEALLAHELAHIARSDYLVNIFQSVVDIVFFYHPAVHWISSFVRHEREHCCDDMAVVTMGNSRSFARALANIYSWGFARPGFAMNLARNEHKLFHRIRRITKMKNRGTTSVQGLVVACVLGLLCIAFGLSAGTTGILGYYLDEGADEVQPAEGISSKKMELKSAQKILLELRAAGKEGDPVKFWIEEPATGKILWKFKDKIKGKELAVKTNLQLGPGNYLLHFTDNCRAKMKVKAKEPDIRYKIENAKKELVVLKQKIGALSKEGKSEISEEDREKKLAELLTVAKKKEEMLAKLEAVLKAKEKEYYEQEKITYQKEKQKQEEEKRKIEEFKKQKRMELEKKLQQIIIMIEDLEAKEGERTQEEQDKLKKLQQIRQELETALDHKSST
jgi:beta-lactamase regulating signal transducer with metallopeptidase domain